MKFIDYNGEGMWSREAILSRYEQYCRDMSTEDRFDLTPQEHVTSSGKWVYPVMDRVIEGIESGDRGCIEIGIEFIEEDQGFTFGRILKSNTARALRRAPLSDCDKERIRARVVQMLLDGNVPRAFKQYAKLLKRIGVEPVRPIIESGADRGNPYVNRWIGYLLDGD